MGTACGCTTGHKDESTMDKVAKQAVTEPLLKEKNKPIDQDQNVKNEKLDEIKSTTLTNPLAKSKSIHSIKTPQKQSNGIISIDYNQDEQATVDFQKQQQNSLLKYNNYDIQEQQQLPVFTDDCSSIKACLSINRIIDYLNKYVDTPTGIKMQQIFNENNCPYLTDDYNHVLMHHLGDNKSTQQIKYEYEAIYDYIMLNVKECKLEKCSKYQRNNRNRETDNILDGFDMDTNVNLDHKLGQYLETMDTIHCFFLHTFDVGLRIRSKEIDNLIHNSFIDTKDEHDIDLCTDKVMDKLSTYLKSKLERVQKIGRNRTNESKFCTNVNQPQLKVDKKDDDVQDNQDNTVISTSNALFSINEMTKNCNKVDKPVYKPKPKPKSTSLKKAAMDICGNSNMKPQDIISFFKFMSSEQYDSDCIIWDVEDTDDQSNIYYKLEHHLDLFNEIKDVCINGVSVDDGDIDNKEEKQERKSSFGQFSQINKKFENIGKRFTNITNKVLNRKNKINFSAFFDNNSGSFSFGNKYNYWRQYDDCYVKPKYDNMYNEVLNNQICCIDISAYNTIKEKAQNKMNTKHVKNLIADINWEREYNIKQLTLITQEHIMSVLFYTDMDSLSYNFSSTFRAIDKTDDFDICKARNSEYANWAKLLIETVNVFGTQMDQSKIKKYYHGINSLLIFSSFVVVFNSPTSTTPQIEIATIFAKETGAILELQKDSGWLRYFNCTWLSSFANEDERLFICPPGNLSYQMRFSSIRSVANHVDYKWYIHALTAIDYLVSSIEFHAGNQKIKKNDIYIIKKFIKQTTFDYDFKETKNVVLAGYMSKRGYFNTEFKKRWYILYSNDVLSRYEDPKSNKKAGKDLNMCHVIDMKVKDDTFLLITAERPHLFKCVNKQDTELWINKIKLRLIPKYIQDLFYVFTKKRTYINIDTVWMKENYPSLTALFFDEYLLIRLNLICSMFKDCVKIAVDYKYTFEFADYRSKLLNHLKALNKLYVDDEKSFKLESIKLDNVNFDGVKLKSYKSKFQKLKWSMENDGEFSIVLTRMTSSAYQQKRKKSDVSTDDAILTKRFLRGESK